jgi:taurine dioxygenase
MPEILAPPSLETTFAGKRNMNHLQETTPIDLDKRYHLLQIKPRMPNFAAWVEGIDLTATITEPIAAELRQALADFEVLFFRPQIITPEQHVALASAFGEISPGSFFLRRPDAPNVEIIEFNRQRPPEINNWHSDITWQPEPPLGTCIQITETPPHGGNTAWSSMSKAFAALSPAMQGYLESLTATHTWEVSAFREALGARGDDAVCNAIRAFKPVSHKVVQTHPESGRKCLFVNETFTKAIDGVHFRESRWLLNFLYHWIQQPEFMVHHEWQQHGIAIWDNRSTQHYALADYWPHRRVNQRVTVQKPFATAHESEAAQAARAAALGAAREASA